jgi:hypothetical protein
MHLKSEEKPSKLDFIPSHGGAQTFRKCSKVFKRYEITKTGHKVKRKHNDQEHEPPTELMVVMKKEIMLC